MENLDAYAALVAAAIGRNSGATSTPKGFDPASYTDKYDPTKDNASAYMAKARFVPTNVKKSDVFGGIKVVSAKVVQYEMTNNGLPMIDPRTGSVRKTNRVELTLDGGRKAYLSSWEGNKRDEVAPERDLDVKNLRFFNATSDGVVQTSRQLNGTELPTLYVLDADPKERE